MKALLAGLIIILFSYNSIATIRIAVIDTGFNSGNVKLCKTGHKDFTGTGLMSRKSQHGQNIINIIGNILKDTDYCIINIKFLDEEYSTTGDLIPALAYARELNPDFLNISAGGEVKDQVEAILIKKMLNEGVKILAAAGNKSRNLDNDCFYHPACSDNKIITVGSVDNNGQTSSFSNYGNYVKAWENGEKVDAGGVVLSGTSQATAKRTGFEVMLTMSQRAEKSLENINKFLFRGVFNK